MGKSYKELILDGSDNSMVACETILRCTEHRDERIAETAFTFWRSLASDILQMEDREMQKQKIEMFSPLFVKLTSVLHKQMQYPFDYDELEDMEIEDFKKFRKIAAYRLDEACKIVGADVFLRVLWDCIGEVIQIYENDPSQWQCMEAALFSFRNVANNIDISENVILPRLFDLITKLDGRHHKELRYTAVLVISRYADWLNNHGDLVPNVLTYVGDNIFDKSISNASCLSFKHLLDGCRNHFLTPDYLDAFFSLYERGLQDVSPEDMCDVVAGICFVSSSLSPDLTEQAVFKLLEPVANNLHNLLQHVLSNGTSKEQEKLIASSLNLLTCVFRYIDPKQSFTDSVGPIVMSCTEKLLPVLNHVLNFYKVFYFFFCF